MTKILDLEPIGFYADGSPRYKFSTSFPSRGVRALKEGFDTIEDAAAHAEEFLSDYRKSSWPGGMGQFLGVTEKDDKFHGVVNTYWSST